MNLRRNLSRSDSFSGENFFQQSGGLGGTVGADIDLLLSNLVEEAVEGFADDILVEIELVGDSVAAGSGLDDVIVLLDYADALQRAVDDRSERGREIGGTGLLEVFGGRGVAASEDAAGVAKRHFLEGIEKNLFGLRRGAFGGAIHADFEIVHRVALANHPHSLAHGLQFGGEQDANGFVIQESIWFARERDGLARGEFQRLLESGDDLVVGRAGSFLVLSGRICWLAIFGELSCGIGTEEDRQRGGERRKTHGILHGKERRKTKR